MGQFNFSFDFHFLPARWELSIDEIVNPMPITCTKQTYIMQTEMEIKEREREKRETDKRR